MPITAHRPGRYRRNFCNATSEQSDFIGYWQSELEILSTEQILRWAADIFPSRLALLTSCGVGGSVLISMLGRMRLNVPVISADAGCCFGEVKRLYDRLEEKYGVRVESGCPIVFEGESPLCCGERKYGVLSRTADGFDAWISEIGEDHSSADSDRPVLDWDERFGVFRISPLVRWTGQSIMDKAVREAIPFDEYSEGDYFESDCHACLFGEKSGRTDPGQCCRGSIAGHSCNKLSIIQ